MSEAEEQPPKHSQIMDKKLLLSVPKVATAIVIVTGFLLLLGGDIVAGYGAVVAFVLAIAFSMFEAKHEKVIATHGPMGVISAIINAASIFVASAGINSSLASVVGGSETTFGKFVQPWFTPVQAKESIKALDSNLTSTKETLGIIKEATAPKVTGKELESSTTQEIENSRQNSQQSDSILTNVSLENAKPLLKKGETEFQIVVENLDGTRKLKTFSATSEAQLKDSISYFGSRYRGWYVVVASSMRERELQMQLRKLQGVAGPKSTVYADIPGVRGTPEIWPPSKESADKNFKLIALFGVKDKASAERARLQLVDLGYPNAELMKR